LFFDLSSLALGVLLVAAVSGTTVLGLLLGRRLLHTSETLREPLAAVQTALLALVGLLLAFGLAMAVGRYDARRAAVVADANAIETTYLRAQTLQEPVRSQSLERLRRYVDTTIRLSGAVPGSDAARRAIADGEGLQRELWALAATALERAPAANATRLYVESLNTTIDMQTVRISALGNRVPSAVLVLEVVGAAAAFGLLAVYLALLGRGVLPVLLASLLVSLLLLVTFDLDRPTRGLIEVPATPLVHARASMALPPAASAPAPGG
jgi:hypothetical protein